MTVRVAALGGSLLRPEVEDRQAWLRSLSESVMEINSRGIRLVLVVGGGAPAREGIELAKPLIGDDVEAGRAAEGSQFGLSARYQRPIAPGWIVRTDAMMGFLENVDDIRGVRFEVRRKF